MLCMNASKLDPLISIKKSRMRRKIACFRQNAQNTKTNIVDKTLKSSLTHLSQFTYGNSEVIQSLKSKFYLQQKQKNPIRDRSRKYNLLMSMFSLKHIQFTFFRQQFRKLVYFSISFLPSFFYSYMEGRNEGRQENKSKRN